jgi:glycosyltransferase involved in cell wall biosynthesis
MTEPATNPPSAETAAAAPPSTSPVVPAVPSAPAAPSVPASPAGKPKLSVLMPVYNERRTLRTIIRRVLEAPIPVPLELIAVDDCSRDGSREILRELAAADPRIKPVFHEKNTGKGGAIHTAIAHMTGDIAIVQDADLEYDPADIPRVLKPILDGKADAVFGSRFLGSEARRVLYYWHSVANGFLTWVSNLISDLNLTDMETCYKAVRADILKQTRLKFKRFGIEPELTLRLAQWGARIYEVPISYSGRTYAEGKKITWKDGVRALLAILNIGLWDTRFTTHDGYYILQSVRNAGGFNRWMFSQIAPYVGQRVLEAGCGIGNLTELMLDRQRLVAADIDPLYVEMIGRRFGHLENFRVTHMDLAKTEDVMSAAGEGLDTIICLNVLEHIADDRTVLANFLQVLKPGGHAIILVPQYMWLYTGVDKTLGHERRYTADELIGKMRAAGFEVVHHQGFNRMGVPGWWTSCKLLGNTHLKPGQMRMFNRLLWVAKLLEKVPGLPGLSVICVGRKPG